VYPAPQLGDVSHDRVLTALLRPLTDAQMTSRRGLSSAFGVRQPMRSTVPHELLITARDLAQVTDRATILDASWIYGPFNEAGIDVRARYAEAHIPDAWFLDLEALSDPDRILDPRVAVITPPRADVLGAVMARTGADPCSLLVVTDMDGGCTTAPFARHALLEAGFRDVRLLDGGTPAWRAAGGEVTDAQPRHLDASTIDPSPPVAGGERVFAGLHELVSASRGRESAQIVDSRAFKSNHGVLPDDYAGLEIPAAVHVSSSAVVEEAGAGLRFKQPSILARLFCEAGVDPRRRKITTCYFGLGSSVVAAALEIAGWGEVRPHPGSLVEYAVRHRLVRPR